MLMTLLSCIFRFGCTGHAKKGILTVADFVFVFCALLYPGCRHTMLRSSEGIPSLQRPSKKCQVITGAAFTNGRRSGSEMSGASYAVRVLASPVPTKNYPTYCGSSWAVLQSTNLAAQSRTQQNRATPICCHQSSKLCCLMLL